jgi:hypothetical protein
MKAESNINAVSSINQTPTAPRLGRVGADWLPVKSTVGLYKATLLSSLSTRRLRSPRLPSPSSQQAFPLGAVVQVTTRTAIDPSRIFYAPSLTLAARAGSGKRDGGRRRRLDPEEGGAAEPSPVGQRVRRGLAEDPDELRSRCFPQYAHQRRRRLAENSDELREDPDKRRRLATAPPHGYA